MKWTDTLDIVLALIDEHPDVDPLTVRFTELKAWVEALPEFDDEPERCGERILEALSLIHISEPTRQEASRMPSSA